MSHIFIIMDFINVNGDPLTAALCAGTARRAAARRRACCNKIPEFTLTSYQNPVTLERGRPVTDTELLCRADWIRHQAVDLIAQAGLGHYTGCHGV